MSNGATSSVLGTQADLDCLRHTQQVDDIEISTIEIEKPVGENYPKGWRFINDVDFKVKRVQPYILSNLSTFKDIESVHYATLAANQKLIGVYGWENDYGIANIGFIVKEAILQ